MLPEHTARNMYVKRVYNKYFSVRCVEFCYLKRDLKYAILEWMGNLQDWILLHKHLAFSTVHFCPKLSFIYTCYLMCVNSVVSV